MAGSLGGRALVHQNQRIKRGWRRNPRNCGVTMVGGSAPNCAVVLPGPASAELRASKIAVPGCIILAVAKRWEIPLVILVATPPHRSCAFKTHLAAMEKAHGPALHQSYENV